MNALIYIPHPDFNRSRLRGRQNETTTTLKLTELAAGNSHQREGIFNNHVN